MKIFNRKVAESGQNYYRLKIRLTARLNSPTFFQEIFRRMAYKKRMNINNSCRI